MSIRLSKRHGVNPSMGTCVQCGKETGEIILVGNCNRYECRNCGAVVFGKSGKCHECGGSLLMMERDIKAPRYVPFGLCADCKKSDEECAEVVRLGGIYWRCKDCGSAGAIRAESTVAVAVREKTGLKTGACGIEFSKEDCPVCGSNS